MKPKLVETVLHSRELFEEHNSSHMPFVISFRAVSCTTYLMSSHCPSIKLVCEPSLGATKFILWFLERCKYPSLSRQSYDFRMSFTTEYTCFGLERPQQTSSCSHFYSTKHPLSLISLPRWYLRRLNFTSSICTILSDGSIAFAFIKQ